MTHFNLLRITLKEISISKEQFFERFSKSLFKSPVFFIMSVFLIELTVYTKLNVHSVCCQHKIEYLISSTVCHQIEEVITRDDPWRHKIK